MYEECMRVCASVCLVLSEDVSVVAASKVAAAPIDTYIMSCDPPRKNEYSTDGGQGGLTVPSASITHTPLQVVMSYVIQSNLSMLKLSYMRIPTRGSESGPRCVTCEAKAISLS